MTDSHERRQIGDSLGNYLKTIHTSLIILTGFTCFSMVKSR